MGATDRTFPFIKLQNAVVHLQKRKKKQRQDRNANPKQQSRSKKGRKKEIRNWALMTGETGG
jgi:uncharacterized protein YxeA